MSHRMQDWLDAFGLGNYASLLAANGIDLDIVGELNEADLERLGIGLGDRKRLMKAIASLTSRARPPASSAVASEPIPPAYASMSGSEAQRRQLTVMFCDLVGSTALSRKLDPEDLRETIVAYQRLCASVIARYDGFVARYLGDGILVYFGWPRAHENEAERAVRAALAIVAAMQGSGAPTAAGERLAVRIGIATGAVVVGDLIGEGAAQEAAATGETPNLAARLQEVAPPDGVLIAPSTYALTGTLFECVDHGECVLKGFPSPLRTWRVLRERQAESRFEAARAERLTPFVGREQEIGLILECWRVAAQGEGQVVLLSGEAGIGKSRIAQILRERIAGEAHTRLRYQCSPYHTSTAFHPFIAQLERAADFGPDDTAEVKLAKIEALLASSGSTPEEIAPIFAALLSIPTGDRYPPLEVSPQRLKERITAALTDQLVGLAAQQPVLVIFEDAHWADPTSLEVLERAIARVERLRTLALITFRSEFEGLRARRPHVTSLTLNRLSRMQAGAMVTGITAGKGLPSEVLEHIVAKTDGIPLFVEELTRTVLESGLLADAGERYELTRPLPPLAIPATLQDSLMARLDRLDTVKELAQIGAAIGREFPHRLLAAVAPMRDADLDDRLNRLVDSGLVFRQGSGESTRYVFKHALVQDAAYQSLLRAKRRDLHCRVAEVLETSFRDDAENRPEVLAHHYLEGSRFLESTRYSLAAGQIAIKRSANVEATAHLRKALATVAQLPDRAAAAGLELSIQLNLGVALTASQGFGSASVEAAFARARELCAAVSNAPELLYAVCGLGSFYTARAELDSARDVAQTMLDVGHASDNVDLLLWGNVAIGVTELHSGSFEAARRHLEDGIGLYDPERHGGHAFLVGQDAGVVARCHLAWATWFLGEPACAAEHMACGIELAKCLPHPFSRAYALTFAAWLSQFMGDPDTCRRRGNEAVAIAQEHGFPLLLGMALVVTGWAELARGAADAALTAIRDGMTMYEATGAQLGKPAMTALLAVTTARAGDLDGALRMMETARGLAASHAEGYLEAELQRLTAELVLAGISSLSATACSDARGQARRMAHAALHTATAQRALSLMLRAALTALRTAAADHERADDVQALAHVCAQFDAGASFDELARARALIVQAGER